MTMVGLRDDGAVLTASEILTAGSDQTRALSIADYHGWFSYGSYFKVYDGIYRVKVQAHVEGPDDVVSYLELIDARHENRIHAAHTFKRDPELFVRLYRSDKIELRFRTAGERLNVSGVEIEALMLDGEPVDADHVAKLALLLSQSQSEPAALYRALDRLAALGGGATADRIQIQSRTERTDLSVEPEIWSRLLNLHGPISNLNAQLVTRSLPPSMVWTTVKSAHFDIVDLTNATPEVRSVLRSRGYQPELLEATQFHRDSEEPDRLWHEQLFSDVADRPIEFKQPLFERFRDIDRSYETSLAQGKGFPAYCPVTGAFLRSQHGFLIQFAHKPFIFYRFEGAETFYVCTGANSDTRLMIYMPRSAMIVQISDPAYKVFSSSDLVSSLNNNLALFPNEAAAYLREPTKPAAVIGSDNYGHFFWVDISGLQFAVENDLHKNLHGLIKAPFQFGDIEDIFPELAHLPVHDCETQQDAFYACISNNYLPIHFSDIAINSQLATRLRNLARARASVAGTPPMEMRRPLLWLNLRAHNKIWRNQIDGYSHILNALAAEYGQVSALLDGVPDCRKIVEEITSRCGPQVSLYDGLNFSLYDKMNWAMASDGYICVIGTGLVICHSLAGAQGVAHGNREHMTQLDFWHTIQTGSPKPLAPRMEEIYDSGSELQRDYDVDWNVLLALIRSHLSETFVAKG